MKEQLENAQILCETILSDGKISDRDCPNLKYKVGLYGLLGKTEEEDYDTVKNWLQLQGYTVLNTFLCEGRPSWLAYESVVLYYSSDSKDKANEIAQSISNLLGKKIESRQVDLEDSIGVSKDQEKFYFYIHIL